MERGTSVYSVLSVFEKMFSVASVGGRGHRYILLRSAIRAENSLIWNVMRL